MTANGYGPTYNKSTAWFLWYWGGGLSIDTANYTTLPVVCSSKKEQEQAFTGGENHPMLKGLSCAEQAEDERGIVIVPKIILKSRLRECQLSTKVTTC